MLESSFVLEAHSVTACQFTIDAHEELGELLIDLVIGASFQHFYILIDPVFECLHVAEKRRNFILILLPVLLLGNLIAYVLLLEFHHLLRRIFLALFELLDFLNDLIFFHVGLL